MSHAGPPDKSPSIVRACFVLQNAGRCGKVDLVKSFIAYKLINHQTRIDLLAIFIDIDTYYWGLQSGMVQFLLVLEFIPIQLQGKVP